MLILLVVVALVTLWVLAAWADEKKVKHKAELAAALLAQHKIEGTEQDIQFFCDRLLTDDEYVLQIINSASAVSFGSSGKVQLTSVPEITFAGENMAMIEKDGKHWEIVRMDYGAQHVVRISEIGARGGVGKSIQVPEYELLRALSGLEVIKEL